MKGMKVRFLKKLKSIRPLPLKQGRVLQLYASDGLASSPPDSGQLCQNLSVHKEDVENSGNCKKRSIPEQPTEVIDVSELMKDLEEEEEEECFASSIDKENIRPTLLPVKKSESSILSGSSRRHPRPGPLSELDVSSFRRPELNSGCLFDPDLLAAFEQVVMEHIQTHETETKSRGIPPREVVNFPAETRRKDSDPLLEFDERCPPKGGDSVVLYTTTLRAIRKTFEDCNSVRFLLSSLRVLLDERDVSMHSEFREELQRILGCEIAVPPRVFIKGRYIGGAEEVLSLHEQGKLQRLVLGVPAADTAKGTCEGCGGIRFVPCFECNGSRKLACDDPQVGFARCPRCNENGLILCPICCPK